MRGRRRNKLRLLRTLDVVVLLRDMASVLKEEMVEPPMLRAGDEGNGFGDGGCSVLGSGDEGDAIGTLDGTRGGKEPVRVGDGGSRFLPLKVRRRPLPRTTVGMLAAWDAWSLWDAAVVVAVVVSVT